MEQKTFEGILSSSFFIENGAEEREKKLSRLLIMEILKEIEQAISSGELSDKLAKLGYKKVRKGIVGKEGWSEKPILILNDGKSYLPILEGEILYEEVK